MDKTVEIYKCLGNETRLSIVRELARRGGEVLGSELLGGCSVALGLAQPTLSQHFSRLVRSGILIESKRGVEKYYRVDASVLEASGVDVAKLTVK